MGDYWCGGVEVLGSCNVGGVSAWGELRCSWSWCGEDALLYSCSVGQVHCEGGMVWGGVMVWELRCLSVAVWCGGSVVWLPCEAIA